MTPEERKQAFAEAYNALVKQYGCVIVAVAQNEQLSGGELLIKQPKVDLAFVDNWQPEMSAPSNDTAYPVQADITLDDVNRARSNGHKEKA